MLDKSPIAKAIQPDGSLQDISWYLEWDLGKSYAILDGYFESNDLRAIADWMDAHQPVHGQPTVNSPTRP